MLTSTISKAGQVTRSRTAFAFVAATLLVGGTATEASAKSRHHHYAHRHHHHHLAQTPSNEGASWGSPFGETSSAESSSKGSSKGQSWRNANAAISASSGAGRTFSGVASYYGNESGRKTASGQRFNQNEMTCAHRSLPFGTKLKVSSGGRSVVVTVNDRGPFVRGRVLDLSKGAARALGMGGLARVTAEVVS
jgi:peptidoglycan lytic transglycosylase